MSAQRNKNVPQRSRREQPRSGVDGTPEVLSTFKADLFPASSPPQSGHCGVSDAYFFFWPAQQTAKMLRASVCHDVLSLSLSLEHFASGGQGRDPFVLKNSCISFIPFEGDRFVVQFEDIPAAKAFYVDLCAASSARRIQFFQDGDSNVRRAVGKAVSWLLRSSKEEELPDSLSTEAALWGYCSFITEQSMWSALLPLSGSVRARYWSSPSNESVPFGQDGAIPVLSSSFQRTIQCMRVKQWPSQLSSTLLSSYWSRRFADIWSQYRGQYPSCTERPEKLLETQPQLPLDFEWRSVGSDGKRMYFRSHPLDFANRDDEQTWKLLIGARACGTSFRRATKTEDSEKWRANTIVNMYHVISYDSSGDPVLNVYRHGIIGFMDSSPNDPLGQQTALFLKDGLEQQRRFHLPERVVSHNLVDQFRVYKERKMLDRQRVILSQVVDQLTEELPYNFSLAELFLPTNTDESIMGISDNDRRLNFPGAIQYLLWIAQDTRWALSKVLFPEYHQRRFSTVDDKRWCQESLAPCSYLDSIRGMEWMDVSGMYYSLAKACNEDIPAIAKLFGPLAQQPDRLGVIRLIENMEAVSKKLLLLLKRGTDDARVVQSILRNAMIILSSVTRTVHDSVLQHRACCTHACIPQGVQNDLERTRISINLFRVLLHAEVFDPNDAAVDFPHRSETDRSSILSGKRRLFPRTTALYATALLDQCLGAAVYVNCKSGLDRTGIFLAIQQAVTAMWFIYPEHRWNLHCTISNFNFLQARCSERDRGFVQPPPPHLPQHNDSFNTASPTLQQYPARIHSQASSTEPSPEPSPSRISPQQSFASQDIVLEEDAASVEDLMQFLRENSGTYSDPLLLKAVPPEPVNPQSQAPERGWTNIAESPERSSDLDLSGSAPDIPYLIVGADKFIFDGNTQELRKLVPIFSVLRNFAVIYLVEVNATVCYLSCGVRGMKYRNHALVGNILPDYLTIADGTRLQLTSRKVSVTYAYQVLTDLGEKLLVDSAYNRKS